MRWLIVPLLWLLAAFLVVGVLWRMRRGKPIVLRGRWTPRVLRMTAVLLVFLGVGIDRAEAAPVPIGGTKTKSDDVLPPTSAETAQKWLAHQGRSSHWSNLKIVWTMLQPGTRALPPEEVRQIETLTEQFPAVLRTLLLEGARAMTTGKPFPIVTMKTLLTAAREAEQVGLIDPWLIAHLWRRSAGVEGTDRREKTDLMARLKHQARLHNALVAVRFVTRPIAEPPIAWRGKAGRPPGGVFPGGGGPIVRQPQISLNLAQLDAAWKKADAGTWETDSRVLLTVEEGSAPATLVRNGQGGVPMTRGVVSFGRLDLIESGERAVVLTHRDLGRIEIPAGKLLSVWELSPLLTEKARETSKRLIGDALAGKEPAAQKLETMLPLIQSMLREELARTPNAPGAAKMRLILSSFDDVPPSPPPIELPSEPRFERGR